MDRKIVIVNAEKMDYDHRLDFSAMGAGVCDFGFGIMVSRYG